MGVFPISHFSRVATQPSVFNDAVLISECLPTTVAVVAFPASRRVFLASSSVSLFSLFKREPPTHRSRGTSSLVHPSETEPHRRSSHITFHLIKLARLLFVPGCSLARTVFTLIGPLARVNVCHAFSYPLRSHSFAPTKEGRICIVARPPPFIIDVE